MENVARKDSERLGSKKMPALLIIVEIILAMELFRYMFAGNHSIYPYSTEFNLVFMRLVSIGYNIWLCIFVVMAMMGVTSSKPRSWAAVIRSVIMLMLTNIVYDYFSTTKYYNELMAASTEYIDDGTALILMLVALTIMFLPRTRRYYTPLMQEVPPIRDWIKYAFYIPLFRAKSYRFVYPLEQSKNPTESVEDTIDCMPEMEETLIE